MGASQSLPISFEAAFTAVAVAGAIGLGVSQLTKNTQTAAEEKAVSKKGKKKNQNKAEEPEPPAPVAEKPTPPAPAIIPGQFDPSAPLATSKKPKKKKAKATKAQSKSDAATASQTEVHSESSIDADLPAKPAVKPKRQQKKQVSATTALQQSALSVDTDSSWTRVEARRRLSNPSQSDTGAHELSATSDAGITTSLTGTSSVDEEGDSELSPVIPIIPRPGEKPAEGFSWGDYEDVRISDDTGGGDDDGGWGVVKSRGRTKASAASSTSQSQKAPETLNKRQRQNAQRREAQKAAKAEAEADRLARLAKHNRELEKERIAEEVSKAYSVGKKTVGGGMTANVDSRGKLVWE